MAAPFHKILSKTERAIVAYLVAQGVTGAMIVSGKNSNVKTLPVVIIWAKHWEVSPPHGTEFMVDVTISVKVSAPPDAGETAEGRLAASNALLGPVFGSFTEPDANNGGDIPNNINTAAYAAAAADPDDAANNKDLSDFTCLNIVSQSGDSDGGKTEDGMDVWIDSMDLKLRCSPYAIS